MLDTISQELAALTADDRAAILEALDVDERARVVAAMRGAQEVVDSAEPGRHSAWMTALMDAAVDPDDERMTTNTRASLLEAVGRGAPTAARGGGRSLLQAAGHAFAQVRAR